MIKVRSGREIRPVRSTERLQVLRVGPAGKMAGMSYLEVLIATALVVMALVPAMEALQPARLGSDIQGLRTEDHFQLVARLEEVLAEPFADLDDVAAAAGSSTTPTSYSDVVTHTDGRQITRNVFLARYDGDNADADNDPFTGADADLLWLRVEIPGTTLSLETLINAYD